MQGRVIITEKPSVAETIALAIGGAKRFPTHWETTSGYVITWAVGHLISLAPPEHYNPAWKSWDTRNLPLLPDKYVWLPNDDKAQQRLNEIRDVIAKAKPVSIINACDAAREGEYIFRLIWAELKLEGKYPMERMWLRSMTPDGVQRALSAIEPGAKFRNMAVAAAARSMADWAIGMSGTRAVTNVLQKKGAREIWSIGRVQTPTLAIIADRDYERRSFVPEAYQTVQGTFGSPAGAFPATWQSAGEPNLKNPVLAATIAERCQGQTGTIQDSVKIELRDPPPLFDLTTLQRYVNVKLGWTANDTLQVAQKLYEREKVLTYPRTESTALPEDYEPEAQRVMDSLTAQGYPTHLAPPVNQTHNKIRVFDNKAVNDHFALIPTGTPLSAGADLQTKQLYDIIVGRFIAAFCPPEKVAVIDRSVVVNNPTKDEFHTKLEQTMDPGWRTLFGKKPGATVGEPLHGNAGDSVTATLVEVKNQKTQPPPVHTEATLLEQMCKDKHASLGTASTRASIIEGLKGRDYIQPSGKGLESSPKGQQLISALRERGLHDMTSPQMTGTWEGRLLKIEQGKEPVGPFNADMRVATQQYVDLLLGRAKPKAPPSLSF